jgi:CRISPR-associated protein Csb2
MTRTSRSGSSGPRLRRGAAQEAAADAAPASDGPQAFRWRLAGAEPLPITQAARLGEAVRAAVYRNADERGLLPLPNAFHKGTDRTHGNAFWLPEDADEDGFIDHMVVFAETGLPDALIPVLAAGGDIYLGRLGEWRLRPDWMGRRGAGGLFGPALHWITATPYIPPLKWERSPERQIRREIAQRILPFAAEDGMPLPIHVELGPDVVRARFGRIPAESFQATFKNANRTARRPANAVARGVEIVFDQPVWGPLALGFGAHFGLGLFEPVA